MRVIIYLFIYHLKYFLWLLIIIFAHFKKYILHNNNLYDLFLLIL